jgi:signal transduction histidine kinase
VLNAFVKALKIKDSIGDIRGLAITNYEIAEYYYNLRDTINALTYAQTAKQISKETGNNRRLLESLELMAKVDPVNSSKYTQEYIKLNDSLIREERTTRNKFTRIRFETDEFIEQNELLTRQRQLWIGIAIALFVLAAFILITIDQRRKNQKLRFEQAQQKANQEIFNLLLAQNKKVEEGKQLEKKRISEELHDGILGQMLGIRLILSALNNKTDSDSVLKRSDLLKKLQGLEEEIRTISHELSRASQEKIHNFIVSIEELVRTIQDSSKMKCHFEYDDKIDWDHLKGDIKINIYRIVQESLQNCIKHAKATKVDLLFQSENDHVRIIVSDNGVGFDQKKGKRGIGLKNINSRLEKLNGTYDIQSKIGQGTKVIVTIPCIMEEQAEPQSA